MFEPTLEEELYEALAVLIAALEAAHGLSERVSVLLGGGHALDLARASGGVEALLELAVQHNERVQSGLRRLPAQAEDA